jgi:hypothetical protein
MLAGAPLEATQGQRGACQPTEPTRKYAAIATSGSDASTSLARLAASVLKILDRLAGLGFRCNH